MLTLASASLLPTRGTRRCLAAALTLLCAAILIPAAAARAATPLIVVGTSDVQDSGLVPNLIAPGFDKAYPQFQLQYVSKGTGAAIQYAEAGNASALIVHAASLENQFVANGYSAEKFGRAVFWGDFVLLGPKSDPAHVLSGAPHDIVTALQDIAAAGAAGRADYVSRADTSGTAVEEHKIWGLATPSSSLTLCPVSSANGGGSAPSSTSSCGSTPTYPSWYHATGLTQGPNVENANTCNYTNALTGGAPDCYVLTDRGTYDCLLSAGCAGGQAAPTNLRVAASANGATARGGSTLLVNSFHAYAINPAKFTGTSAQINSAGATDLLNFLTSSSFQSQLKTYLASSGSAPFIADAAPAITVGTLPRTVTGGQPVTVTGTVKNVVPGTPPLVGQTVQISQTTGLVAGLPIASTKTDASGAFTLRFTPPGSGTYQITTPQIAQIEIPSPTLTPPYGDLLSPGSTSTAQIKVRGVLSNLGIRGRPGLLEATGSVAPGRYHVSGTVTVYGRRGNRGGFRKLATTKLGAKRRPLRRRARPRCGTLERQAHLCRPGSPDLDHQPDLQGDGGRRNGRAPGLQVGPGQERTADAERVPQPPGRPGGQGASEGHRSGGDQQLHVDLDCHWGCSAAQRAGRDHAEGRWRPLHDPGQAPSPPAVGAPARLSRHRELRRQPAGDQGHLSRCGAGRVQSA